MSAQSPRRHCGGFTLIELMATVACVAILATLAVSSYSGYVKRANRTYATNALANYAQALQRCYSQNFTFSTSCNVVPGTTSTPDGYYNVTVSIGAAGNTFQLMAVPLTAPQTTDSQCMSFTLSSSGQEQALNSQGQDNSRVCWGAG